MAVNYKTWSPSCHGSTAIMSPTSSKSMENTTKKTDANRKSWNQLKEEKKIQNESNKNRKNNIEKKSEQKKRRDVYITELTYFIYKN